MANFPTSVSTNANLYIAVNGIQTTLASSITDIQTTITLTSTSSFPTTGAVTINNLEVVFYTGISGADLTGCTRGADGTSNIAHNAGVTVGLTVVAAHHNLLKDEVIAIESALGTGYSPTTRGNLDDLTDVTVATPAADQVLKFNGTQWVNAPGTTASAGNGIEFFMDDTNVIPTGTNNSIEVDTLTNIPTGTPENIVNIACATNTVLGQAHLYNTAMNRTEITAGVWDFDTWAYVSSTAGGRVSSMSLAICRVRPVTGTSVTITGSGTSRTATASGGTYFNTTDIDASATNTVASYLQTPQGLYQITARTSDTVVTITTPTTYSNEAAVAFSIWKQLFSSSTGTIASTTTSLFSHQTVQPSYPCVATDKLGQFDFATSNNTTTVSHAENGTAHYSHVASPLATLHNDLAGLQGGTGSERYHLTAAELAAATSALPLAGGTMTGDITMSNDKAIIFKETTGNGTDSVTVKAPASVTTSYTVQLPPAVASAGQVLTDAAGNGVLSWASPGTGTVNAGTANQVAYYPSTSSTISGSSIASMTSTGIATGDGTLALPAYSFASDPDIGIMRNSANVMNLVTNGAAGLQVSSTDTYIMRGQLYIQSGTAAAPGLTPDTEPDCGLYKVGTNSIGLSTNGIRALEITSAQAVKIKGTTTNDDATAGDVGQFVSSSVFAQNVGTAGQYSDITSISLTAGDWDVTGIAQCNRQGATFTSVTIFCGISTTSGNSSTGLTTGDTLVYMSYGSDTTFLGVGGTVGAVRMSLASTTTVYLKGYVDGYTVGTPKHYGRISARRVR